MIRHEVLTTEKVPFRYQVAGLGSRLLAWIIDLLFWIVLYIAGAICALVLEAGRPGLGQGLAVLWGFALFLGYFPAFEWFWVGQTPGKRWVGLRVIRLDGTAVGFSHAAVRNLLRMVDALPALYGLAFVVAASNPERRRLGDLAAGTLVVHVARRTPPIRALAEAIATSAGEADRARLALLRQRVSRLGREQKQTLLELCERRDRLRPAERTRLFQATANFLRERLDLEPEAYESDEKFILRLAALLDELEGATEGPGKARLRGRT